MKRSSGTDTSIVLSIIVSSEVNQSRFCEGTFVWECARINLSMENQWPDIGLILDLKRDEDRKHHRSLSVTWHWIFPNHYSSVNCFTALYVKRHKLGNRLYSVQQLNTVLRRFCIALTSSWLIILYSLPLDMTRAPVSQTKTDMKTENWKKILTWPSWLPYRSV